MKKFFYSIVIVLLSGIVAGCGNGQVEVPASAPTTSSAVSEELSSSVASMDSSEAVSSSSSETASSDASSEADEQVKVNLTVGDTVLTVTMQDNVTAQDFLTLLPLTLEMKDEMSREKYKELPRALDEGGVWQETFEVGDFAYWPNGDGLVMFYDDQTTTLHGTSIIVLGTIDDGVEALASVEDPVQVTISLAE